MGRISNTADRLKAAINIKEMKQTELAERTGINKGTLSSYMSGKFEPKQNNLYILAKALNVSEAWLMGYDVPMERKPQSTISFSHPDILPIKTKKWRVIGDIACGEPIYANEDFDSYIEAGADIKADFCVRAKGDSMINVRINDGDIVFIRKQPMVENGQIAAVVIEDGVTLKRFYKHGNKVVLSPENPAHEPLVYTNEELEQIHILGKAVAFQSDL